MFLHFNHHSDHCKQGTVVSFENIGQKNWVDHYHLFGTTQVGQFFEFIKGIRPRGGGSVRRIQWLDVASGERVS